MNCCSEEVDSKGYHQELNKRRRDSGSGVGQPERREDGASIEMVKRRRGRPPGSKNKPKPPHAAIVAAPEVAVLTPSSFLPSSTGGMRAHILEIPGGRDVALALAAFSRRHGVGICVLGVSGSVANVSLRQPAQPSPSSTSTFNLRGRFDVLSVSATFLPPTVSATVVFDGANELKVLLSGQQGRVLGGTVIGPLVTAGTLVVVVAAFSDPTVHHLPAEEEGDANGGVALEAEPHQDDDFDEEENVEDDQGQAPKHQYPHGNYFYDHHPGGGAPGGGLSIFSGQLPSDLLWHTSLPY